MRKFPRFAFFLSVLLLAPALALATVNHGDFIGTGVDFLAVSETTQTAGDAEPLWGTPVVAGSGDQLLFFPPAFISSCSPGTSDITSSLLETDIVAQAGGTIDRFALVEAGDVFVTQFPPPGNPATNASASVTGFLTVTDTTAGPIAPVVIPFSGTFVPTGTFSLPGNFGASTWQGVIDIDVASVVANATKAHLSLDNTLNSNCGAGNTSAFIQKKTVSGPSVAIMVNPIDCDLSLEKTCCIPQPIKPSDNEDICDGKAIRAVFEITGGECGDTTNNQHGKARCMGPDPIADPNGDIVTVTVTRHADKILVNGQVSPVLVDLGVSNTLEFTSTTGQLRRDTKFKIAGPGGTQHVKINTSCRKPLRCDDQFGASKLAELESTLGGTVSCAPVPLTGTTCGAPSGGVGTPCDSKLTEAVFRFSPSDCQNPLPNPQNGKAKCDGDASDANLPVSVTYSGKKRAKMKVSPSSGIQDGDLVTVSSIGHKPGLESNLKLLIQDDDSVEQALEIHASCSQPLACGDRFGSFELLGFKTKNGTEISCDQAPPPLFMDTCEVPAAPPKPHCTSSLEEIQLAYLGNLFGSDCSVSNPQGGQASCTGADLWDEDVSVTLLTAGVEGDPLTGIGVRGLFSITPTNSWQALPSGLDFIATDASGNTQTVWIRTDCDESLNLGDRFGDFVVFGLDRGDGDQHNGHHGCDSDSDSD
ncbi:MAG: hypothetical protein JRH01_04160, partial [Deltaproteobacteria bacterium]|nr:hypothetical protein [Deltaproteobacteria bacterium]